MVVAVWKLATVTTASAPIFAGLAEGIGRRGWRGRGWRRSGGWRGSFRTTAPTASAAAGCLRGSHFRRDARHYDDLSLHVDALIGIGTGLIDDVSVAGEDQIAGHVQGLHGGAAASATAARAEGPIFGIFKSRGLGSGISASTAPAATTACCRSVALGATTAESASAASRSGRHECRLAILWYNLAGHHLDGHHIRLQRAIRAAGAAARLQAPFRQVAGHIERRGIVSARWKIAAFELVGRQKIVVYLQLIFGDGVGISISGNRSGFGRLFGLGLSPVDSRSRQQNICERRRGGASDDNPTHRPLRSFNFATWEIG
jgi:hypothetical protein